MTVHGEVLDQRLPTVWLDQPVHKRICHDSIGPEPANQGMGRVEQGIVFLVGPSCLRMKSAGSPEASEVFSCAYKDFQLVGYVVLDGAPRASVNECIFTEFAGPSECLKGKLHPPLVPS